MGITSNCDSEFCDGHFLHLHLHEMCTSMENNFSGGRKDQALQARIQKKLDEELPQEQMGGMKLGPKVSGNQGLSKS